MITISKLRDRLKLPMEQDGTLKDILDALVARWEQETERLWARRASYVQRFRIDESKRISDLFLELWPIETITKVEEKTVAASTWTELSAEQYSLLDPNRNRLERIGSYWAPMVRVTYTGGYVAEPTGQQVKTPADISEALLIQGEFALIRNGPSMLAKSSENFEGGAGVFLKPDLHPTFAALAAAKRRKV